MNKAKLKHTLVAVVSALAVLGPQLLNLIGTWQSPKAAMVASAIGFVVALCLNGKAVALINLVLPDGQVAAPSSADAITKETPTAKGTQ